MDDEVLANVENAPVVKLLNSVIKQAIKLKASDIHIEPLERNLRIRFRLDGELQEIMSPEKDQPLGYCHPDQIMGKMNIAEKACPTGRPR